LLSLKAGTLSVPHFDRPVGTQVRLRIRARDVMIATRPPEGLSALNLLPGRIGTIVADSGPIAELTLDCAGERLIARVTRRSIESLGLAPGLPVFAVIKAIALEDADLGSARPGTSEELET